MQLCGRPRRTWNREEEEQDEYALGSASICVVEADLQGEELLSSRTSFVILLKFSKVLGRK